MVSFEKRTCEPPLPAAREFRVGVLAIYFTTEGAKTPTSRAARSSSFGGEWKFVPWLCQYVNEAPPPDT